MATDCATPTTVTEKADWHEALWFALTELRACESYCPLCGRPACPHTAAIEHARRLVQEVSDLRLADPDLCNPVHVSKEEVPY